MDMLKEQAYGPNQPPTDLLFVYDDDGNVVALIDLTKRTMRYAGRELPFFVVAGPSEMEYPSFYATALLRARAKRSGR